VNTLRAMATPVAERGLCRWAFCLSLAQTSKPQDMDIRLDSNVEMAWRVFTGAGYEKLYFALLKYKCFQDGLNTDKENLAKYFRLHLHRGIGYLANGNMLRGLEDFAEIINRSNFKRDTIKP